jgi:ABC-type multidrug transport system fused ATPase/permease subunit
MEGLAGADRLFSLLRIRPAVAKTVAGIPAKPPNGDLVLAEVHYTYPGASQPALAGITCEIPAGRTTALVGASGAGKSTIAHLLLRFADPQDGYIRWGDQRLTDISAATLRAQIAWVPQNPYLFNDTVAANIRFGRPDAGQTEVVHAAQQANLHDFIETLPKKYETVIGERAARLSGGEGQRLALARAFLKDAPLVILDEPSANLDPTGEAHLLEALVRLLRGRTALLIAHRLPTVMTADQVLVLADGRLVEKGTHAELVIQKGPYSRFVQAYGGLQ